MYLIEHHIIHRKTIALDKYQFKEIPYPKLVKSAFQNGKCIEESNSILLNDYKDSLEVQNRFKIELGKVNGSKHKIIIKM